MGLLGDGVGDRGHEVRAREGGVAVQVEEAGCGEALQGLGEGPADRDRSRLTPCLEHLRGDVIGLGVDVADQREVVWVVRHEADEAAGKGDEVALQVLRARRALGSNTARSKASWASFTSVLMPTTTTASRDLPKDRMPAAGTALTINSQVCASVGTALISVVLGSAGLDPSGFRTAYLVAAGLLALALLPAVRLPGRRS